MVTQVTFTADEVLKRKVLEKAKKEGITLKAVLLHSMKAYLEGKIQFGMVSKDEETEIEEVYFSDPEIQKQAKKLAQLLTSRNASSDRIHLQE